MNQKKTLLISLLSLGIFFGTASASQAAPTKAKINSQFYRIEQPVPIKILISLGGLGLIGIEIWWFLFSKTEAAKANIQQGIQELKIIVDGGYTPDRIIVALGQPVRLNFLRKDPSSCLEQVLLPDFHKALDLKLDRITPVEFVPTATGEYPFHCGMNIFRGVIEVQDKENTKGNLIG